MNNYIVPYAELLSLYDPNDEQSVVDHAKKLLGKSLYPYIGNTQVSESNPGKGDFGNLLEEAYFKVRNNNESRPDIPECGIEIKSGQVNLVRGTRFSLKERMKVSMIDYMRGFEANNLRESSLWPKLEKILLMLFKRDESIQRILEECIYADLLRWNEDDIKQMSEDWSHIKDMVKSGKASELSEGQTWYLGACTAGSNSSVLREAPGNSKAKVRAFSLKQSYLNYKLGYVSSISGPKVTLRPNQGQTLEEFILDNMKSYLDKPIDQIATMLHRPELCGSSAKNMQSRIARVLLEEVVGTRTAKANANFEQFKKADILEKTISLEPNGKLKESVSFPAFKWVDLDNEDVWEESALYQTLTRKFFFTVNKKQSHGMPIFLGCFFWTMPDTDIEEMRTIWVDTKKKIRQGIYDDFIKKTENDVGHIRTHGRDSTDRCPTPQGGMETKRSFWLNNDYVERIAKQRLGL